MRDLFLRWKMIGRSGESPRPLWYNIIAANSRIGLQKMGGTYGFERDVMEEWELNDRFFITGITRTWRSRIFLYLLAALTINQRISTPPCPRIPHQCPPSPRYRIIQERKASAAMRFISWHYILDTTHSLLKRKEKRGYCDYPDHA